MSTTTVHSTTIHIPVIGVVSVVSTLAVVRIVLLSAHVSTTVPFHRLVNIVEIVRSIIIEFDTTELHM